MITSEWDEADGSLYLRWEDRDKDVPPREAAAEFLKAIRRADVREALVCKETPEVAAALVELPGFTIVGQGGDFVHAWPSGVRAPNMSGVRIVGESDEPVIWGIIEKAGLMDPSDRKWLQNAFGPECYNVVISEGDRDLAFGSAAHGGPVGSVNYIAVVPEARGRGLGRRLMEVLLKELDRVPHKQIKLGAVGNPAAVRLYESLGFVRSAPAEVNVAYLRPE